MWAEMVELRPDALFDWLDHPGPRPSDVSEHVTVSVAFGRLYNSTCTARVQSAGEALEYT